MNQSLHAQSGESFCRVTISCDWRYESYHQHSTAFHCPSIGDFKFDLGNVGKADGILRRSISPIKFIEMLCCTNYLEESSKKTWKGCCLEGLKD
jgi:hypothetical protein